jgi:NAD(P)-dependent dehydrogenase (short-subunit alcohol dehydrogenase family)
MPSMLITGAGSGIGRELVNRAVARGDRVIAGVRSAQDIPGFGEHANLRVVLMDVSSTASVAAAFSEIDAWLGSVPLNIVINCAAICPFGAFEVQSIEVLEQVLNTNAVGSARILRESLPRLRGHAGRIVLLTSLWGKVSGPMLSAYCCSKFAIEAIADAARREINGQDVSITVVEPGVVRTRMVSAQVAGAKQATEALRGEHQRLYGELYRKYGAMITRNGNGGVSADECAAAIERVVFAAHPKPRYRVGSDSKAVTTLARLLPDGALDGLFRRLLG